MTLPLAQFYNPLMDLKGHIKCGRCRKVMSVPVCACGNHTAIIRYYWQGRQYERRRDERNNVLTYPEALRILTLINNDMIVRVKLFDPKDWIDGAVKERRFENQIEEYFEDKRQEVRQNELSPEYIRIISGYNKHYEYFHGMDITVIGKKEIAEFKRLLSGKLPKIKSRQNVLNALKAFFNWLWENGRIPSVPPFPAIKGDNATPRRAVRRDAQAELLDKIPEQFRGPYIFAMQTGVRPGELISILVKSVDLNNRVVWIERSKSGAQFRETTKEGTKLPVPLNDTALAVVRANMIGKFPMDNLFVYPKTGRAWSYKTLYKIWVDYTGNEFKLYEATRHSFCTQVVPLTDSYTAQRLMRHKDKRSTDNYYHAYTETLLEVVQKNDNVVELPHAETDPK